MKAPYFLLILCLFLSTNSFAKKPNILFFLVDDMGIFDTSVPFHYKDGKPVINKLNKVYRTPNMEKLADQGRIFSKAYSYSVCSPTRVTLITGQAAPRHKVTTWTHPKNSKANIGYIKTDTIQSPNWRKEGLDLSLPLLPRLLQKNGYRTLFAGKAHFGADDTPMGNPLNCGFDINIAGYGGGGPGAYHGQKNYSAAWRGGGHDWDIPGLEKYHGTDTFLSEAITLEMNAEIEKTVKMKKPFFSYMSHYAVHVPFETDQRFAANYPQLKGGQLAFATLVEGMDKSLGDMVAKLEELKVAEDTLIIFFSDNGSASPMWSAPLRDKKGSRFEGGSRVPMMVSWAKLNPKNPLQRKYRIPKASREDRLVNCEDIFPTILALGRTKVPKEAVIDGYDIRHYIVGSKKNVRPEEFLVHFPHAHQNRLYSTYVLGDKKIIYNYGNESWEYYDIKKDLGERQNLVKTHTESALKMAKRMIAKLDSQKASYPTDLKTGKAVKPNLKKLYQE